MSAAPVLAFARDTPIRGMRDTIPATGAGWTDLQLAFWQQVRADLRYGWKIVYHRPPTALFPEPIARTYGLDAFWWLYQPAFDYWCDVLMPGHVAPAAYRKAMLAGWPNQPLPPRPEPGETATLFLARVLPLAP